MSTKPKILCFFLLMVLHVHIASAVVLFEDDFSDGDAAGWDVHSGTWAVQNEEYVGLAGGTTLTGDGSWTSYTFEARMKRSEGHNNDFGLLFYVQSGSEHIRFSLGSTDAPPTTRITHFTGQAEGEELAVVVNDPELVDERWYHVRLVLLNDSVQAFVDGTLVAVADNLPLTSGSIGLSSDDPTAYFDDVLVTSSISSDLVEASVDLDPDTLNAKSKGKWVTCYIELPEGCDVSDIDVGSLLLEDTLTVQRSEIQDDVLMVKFDRQALIAYLDGTTGDVTLTVTGELSDGTLLQGADTIRVIGG